MTKEELIARFNPNDPGSAEAGMYGLPFSCEQSDVVIVPVPWEATVSYGGGAAKGPGAILNASHQMDLHHYDYPDLWQKGIAMGKMPAEIAKLSDDTRAAVQSLLSIYESGADPTKDPAYRDTYERINRASETMNQWVEKTTSYWLDKGKKVGLLGGDHSTPLGYFRALANRHESFGILVVDAHMDLRKAYEGFTYSHASIFYNALQLEQVSKLVQVGIRDYCSQEHELAIAEGERVKVYFDRLLQREAMRGVPWSELFRFVVSNLPDKVYVSVDIDGLDPSLCPNTGTPVPGGFQFEQLAYLLKFIGDSGKEVIGFDLCEVAPGNDEWDGNVGSRVLYQMCGMATDNKSK